MSDNLDIIVIGESLVEFCTNEKLAYAETLHKYYGGDVLNTAVTASRLGSRVGFLTKVGNDHFRDYLMDSWQAENIDISCIKIVEGYNGLYIVSREEENKKAFAYYRKKSAATTLSIEDINEEIIERSSIVYSTGITQSLSSSANAAVKKAFSIAGDKDCLVAYDPNYKATLMDIEGAKAAMEEVIEYVDVLILSHIHDAEKLIDINSPDKIIKYFWDRGVATIAVKMGQEGCTIGHNGEINRVPHRDVEVIDTTGTGDAFNGGFLHGLAKGLTPFEAGKLATIVASEQAKGWGAIKSIPSREQVLAEYKKGEA
jgi:2-dehydro-3-deoxygluconokinase